MSSLTCEQTQPVLTYSLHTPQPLGSDEAGVTVPCHSLHSHRPEICCAAHGEKGTACSAGKGNKGPEGGDDTGHTLLAPTSLLRGPSLRAAPRSNILLRKGTCFLRMKLLDPPWSSILITHLCNTCYLKYFFSFLVYFLPTFPLVCKFYEKRDFVFFHPYNPNARSKACPRLNSYYINESTTRVIPFWVGGVGGSGDKSIINLSGTPQA